MRSGRLIGGKAQVFNLFLLVRRRLAFGHYFEGADITQRTIAVLHEHGNHTDWKAHMAARTNLIAHDRHAFFVTKAQPIIVSQNGFRNRGAKFGDLFFASLFLTEFDGLQFQ